MPSAIVKSGLKVSLCDVNTNTLDFDHRQLEKKIDVNTLCVVPTHLFGIPSAIEKINALCRDRGVFVVEDAAQAMLSKEGSPLKKAAP